MVTHANAMSPSEIPFFHPFATVFPGQVLCPLRSLTLCGWPALKHGTENLAAFSDIGEKRDYNAGQPTGQIFAVKGGHSRAFFLWLLPQ